MRAFLLKRHFYVSASWAMLFTRSYNAKMNHAIKKKNVWRSKTPVGLSQFIQLWPDLTGCIHFDPCFEIAYRFYNSGGIETGPRKTHLFNTDDFAVSLRWVFAVPHRIYWSECVIQADEPVHRTRRLMYL